MISHLAFQRGKGDDRDAEQLRISLDEYEGKRYVSARIWYRDAAAGEYRPTKKGITIRARELPDVIAWLMDAERAMGAR
jgi:hypothetical protein